MPLFQRRKRETERASRPPQLSESVPALARGRIGHALFDYVIPDSGSHFGYGINVTDQMVLNEQLHWVLTREWGLPRINATNDDIRNILPKATDSQVLDIVEAWYPATQRVVEAVDASSGVHYQGGSYTMRTAENIGAQYRAAINDIFDDGDVAWQLVGETIVPRSSLAMHATVVEPIFTLTQGDPKLASVEKAYQDALRELKPGGDPSDAITDAGTALQEMLTVAGAKGNALGPLLADARKRGLLAPYDSKLAEAIDAIGDWVSADRSQRGDAHNVRDASRDDAWLAVRVAGALILRLAAGRKR